jgi:hypothetical protein
VKSEFFLEQNLLEAQVYFKHPYETKNETEETSIRAKHDIFVCKNFNGSLLEKREVAMLKCWQLGVI